MYINDVIRRCDILCPNEYSTEEKYMWCDELSSMLMQEYLKKYDRITIEAGDDGTYLLPEGITFEMVERVIDGAREIDKNDFRSYGIEYYYGQQGRFVMPSHHRVRSSIDVVYLRQHEPIRSKALELKAQFREYGFFVNIKEFEYIKEGDIINIVLKADTLSDEDAFEGDEEFNNVSVLKIDMIDDTEYFVSVPNDTFKISSKDKIRTCRITRIVTDETLCPAPYDSMYIDYVNGEICYYQRDFDTYNQHMNLFNQRLAAYRAWLQQRRVQDKDGRITSWF